MKHLWLKEKQIVAQQCCGLEVVEMVGVDDEY
jgi:hypothetical protein